MKAMVTALLVAAMLQGVEKEDVDAAMTAILGKKNITVLPIQRNPFIGARTAEPESAPPASPKRGFGLKVEGIINKKALIGGTLYRVGERVDGYEIQTITERGVTFMKDGIFYAAALLNGESDIMVKRDR